MSDSEDSQHEYPPAAGCSAPGSRPADITRQTQTLAAPEADAIVLMSGLRCLAEVVAALPHVLAALHAAGRGSSAAGDQETDAGLGS